MKTLEAKPFDQNAENWKRENRLFISTVLEAGASGQNRIGTHALRSHRRVWFVFAAQTLVSCQKQALLVTKGFSSPNDTQSREKNCENGGFSTPLTGMNKLYGRSRLYASTQGRHETGGVLSLFFESFLWHFNEKQRAEVIFRLSRPVSCKNQENGSGKQWSLHASLKPFHSSVVLELPDYSEKKTRYGNLNYKCFRRGIPAQQQLNALSNTVPLLMSRWPPGFFFKLRFK